MMKFLGTVKMLGILALGLILLEKIVSPFEPNISTPARPLSVVYTNWTL